ncbi:hypothetical protein B0H67DRAFT_474084 [Lasiosphaeris hirsuta]|uniref:Transcriptional regulator n=1 Tax=Lasiosphaeris hirsuta TaxID=260670 RepID=A0AA40EA21_9PEZI|nr:hypothetical protein B0H67DRAFT_474084 [Lasiosphaeris hirsuta]
MPKKTSDKALEAELVKTIDQLYNSDKRDQLTVNNVRRLVEKKLELGEGFFKEGNWKAKSKKIIYDAIGEIEDAVPDGPSQVSPAPEPEPTPKAKAKNSAKIKKRARKQPTPITSTGSELSELDELSDASEFEKPAKKRKLTGRAKKPAVFDEDEDEDENALTETSDMEMKRESNNRSPTKTGTLGPKAKGKGNTTVISSVGASSKSKPSAKPLPGDESDESIVYDEPPKRKSKSAKHKKAAGKATSPAPKLAGDDGEESQESIVNDELPKRKRKSKGEPTKASKSKAVAKAAPELSSDDILIRQIQSQLVKCGVRKIWGVELKKYGDDKKARIRHLKNMLTEIGMTGRFSESRAKEIKEQRELLADLDAVKEGEKNWGLSRDRSARRRGGKSFRESTDEEEGGIKGGEKAGEDDVGDDSDEDDAQPGARARAHARADLAFLGDESDSDWGTAGTGGN